MNLETKIAGWMRANDYTWKLNGEEIKPHANLIRKNLDGMKASMLESEPGTQMMLGRMIVIKRAPGKFDIYLMIGEDNDS